MAKAPFTQFPGDFESLARQYWNTWNELLGHGGTLDGWALAGGLPPGMGRIDPGAYDWYQRMQRLAGDFSAGGSAADIAAAWRQMLGAHGADPFAGMLRSMHGGLAGGEWLEQLRPLLDMLLRPLRQQGAEWLQRPAFGPAREHQERLQALALAWQHWEERNEEFTALLAQAGQAAFARFERLLEAHDAPGKRLESARALFDLWIDAAEEAWAEIAMSAEYRHAYAEMTNALMRLRLGLQREVEQFGALLGLPGRSELDALHRKVADLERALHATRRGAVVQPAQAQRPESAAARPARAAAAQAPASSHEEVAPAVAAVAPVRRKAAGNAARKPARAPTRKKTGEQAGKQARKAAIPVPVAATSPVQATHASAAATASRPAVHGKPARAASVASRAKSPSAGKAAPAKPSAAKPAAATRRKAAAARAGSSSRRAGTGAAAAATPRKASTPPPARIPSKAKTSARSAQSAVSVSRQPVSSKTAATPATRQPATAKSRRAPVQRAPVPAAAKRAPQASTSTARKAKVAKAGAPRRAPASAASGQGASGAKVVSMKDWVNRNLAVPDTSGGNRGGGGR